MQPVIFRKLFVSQTQSKDDHKPTINNTFIFTANVRGDLKHDDALWALTNVQFTVDKMLLSIASQYAYKLNETLDMHSIIRKFQDDVTAGIWKFNNVSVRLFASIAMKTKKMVWMY